MEPKLAQADVVVLGPGLDVLMDLEPVYRQWRGRLVLTPNRTEAARLLAYDTRQAAEMNIATAVAQIAQKMALQSPGRD